jgi:type I restriction enzyme S subunit
LNPLKKYKFSELYEMGSGISTKPEQAGHGAPFCSFTTVFNNYFLPPELPDRMDTSVDEQETYSLKEGDVLLTRTSETLDELGMSSVAVKDYPKATFSGFLKRLRPTQTDVVYHKFLAFYLRSPLFRKAMNNNAVMTLRCSLNEQIFSYLDLLLPEFDQQKKIGDLLFQIYAKIELNQRINAELEGMAKLLYDYWFVQFDFPMTAAQAAALGKPKLAGHPYRSSGGKMIYNETLKRDIPEGWTTMRFDSFCENFDSKRIPLSKAERSKRQGPIPYYGATGVMDFVDDHIFDGEYVLVAEDGSVMDKDGFPIIQFITGKTWVNNHAHVLRANEPRNNEFLLLSIARIPVINIMTGSIQKKITQDNLNGLLLVRPSTELLESFASFAIPIRQQMVNLQKQNQELTALRDWLLPMLMNGQVTVG